MPTKQIKAAIAKLESELVQYENLLDQSISNNEILAKTKVILRKLKLVSKELNDLKKMKDKTENHL